MDKDDDIAKHILNEQVKMLFSLNRKGLLTALVIGLLLTIEFSSIISWQSAYTWFTILAFILLFRLLLTIAYDRHGTTPHDNSYWLKLFSIGSSGTGLMWGVASVLFFPLDLPRYQLLISIIVVGMTAGAVPFLSSVPKIYIQHSLGALVPFGAYMLWLEGEVYTILGTVTFLYIFMNIISSRKIGETITANIKMRLEKGLLVHDLKNAKNEAERSNRAKSVFISSISHELRTPLNAILGYTQLLNSATENYSPDTKDSLKEITQASNHLLDLIDDVLDLSKIEADLMELESSEVDVYSIVNMCKDLITPTATATGITIDIKNNSDLPLFIMGDSGKFKQVLLNILSNAIKYNSTNGKITITLAHTENNPLRIAISDTGAGISEENLKFLFEPFNRLGKESSQIEGTGLGLAISKKIITLMGGQITVTSEVNKGTTFVLLFPAIKPVNTKVPEVKAEDRTDIITREVAPYSVLYIEDNAVSRKLMEKVLLKHRTTITFYSAETGHEGVKIAEEMLPDIVISDIQLPDMTGYDIVKQLRNNADLSTTAMIALSADANLDSITSGLEVGFDYYLTKPFEFSVLLDTLDRAAGVYGKTT